MRSVRKEVWSEHDPHQILEQCSSEVRKMITDKLWHPVEQRIYVPIFQLIRFRMIELRDRGVFETGH